MGSEPVAGETGSYAGIGVLQAEESKGLAMMRALEPRQRVRATIASVLPSELFAAAFRDNLELGYQGISWNALSDHQQRRLEDLIGTYVGRSGPARIHRAGMTDQPADRVLDTNSADVYARSTMKARAAGQTGYFGYYFSPPPPGGPVP